MAYDKIVDSAALDAGMTATANAIREKTGGAAPIPWDPSSGFQAAVEGIETEGGAALPTLTNPADASDLANGKELIDGDGNVVTGTMLYLGRRSVLPKSLVSMDDLYFYGEPFLRAIVYPAAGLTLGRRYIDSSTMIDTEIPFSRFGDAAAADVAKGKTFTSAAGLQMEGTKVDLDTSDATATASDIAKGVTSYVNGEKVTGVVNVYSGQITARTSDIVEADADDYFVNIPVNVDMLIRSGSTLTSYTKKSMFGTATPDQVAKGATFTSAAGFQATGTMDASSAGGSDADFIRMLERSAGDLTVPEGCTAIGDYAFYSNAAVTSVKLPDTVTKIGYRSFYQCEALASIQLSANLDMVDSQAFYNCKGLTSLTFRSTPASIASNALGACTNLKTIYVPWASGAVANAPWGATNATIHYNHTGG